VLILQVHLFANAHERYAKVGFAQCAPPFAKGKTCAVPWAKRWTSLSKCRRAVPERSRRVL